MKPLTETADLTGGVLPVGLAFALLVRRLSFRPAHDLRGVLGPHLGEPPEGRLPLAEAQKRQGRGLGAQKRFADRFHGLPRLRLSLHSCHAPWNALECLGMPWRSRMITAHSWADHP